MKQARMWLAASSEGMPMRTQAAEVVYSCRDPNGSLRPVLPGESRVELYCRECRAERCLLTGRPRFAETVTREERTERYYREDKAKRRANGRNTGNRPLKESCWNCAEVRALFGGYVCQFQPEAVPVSRGVMIRRANVCESFGWRLEEIRQLDDDDEE